HSENTWDEPHFLDNLRSSYRLDYNDLAQFSKILPFKKHICAPKVLTELEDHNTKPNADKLRRRIARYQASQDLSSCWRPIASTKAISALAARSRSAPMQAASQGCDRNTDRILVLRTYAEQEHDGLTSVFARVSDLGDVVDDTGDDSGRLVLVAGIPFLYVQ